MQKHMLFLQCSIFLCIHRVCNVRVYRGKTVNTSKVTSNVQYDKITRIDGQTGHV